MNKIYFRLVYNRKKKLNKSGKALIQVEATEIVKRFTFRQEYMSIQSNGITIIVELSNIRILKN